MTYPPHPQAGPAQYPYNPYTAAPPRPTKSPEERRRSSRRITAIVTAIAVGMHVIAVGLAAVTLHAVRMSLEAEVDEGTAGLLTALASLILIGLTAWVLIVAIVTLASCAVAFAVWLRALIVHLPSGTAPWPEMFALTTVLLVGTVTSSYVGLVLIERGLNDGRGFSMTPYIALGTGSVVVVLAVATACVVSSVRARRRRA